MQSLIIGLVGGFVVIGLYVLGWIINNPWMFGL